MFKLDSPLMNFLNKLCDIMILNILVLVFSLPIFTIGAAVTAGYYMSFKMVKNEENYIVKGFQRELQAVNGTVADYPGSMRCAVCGLPHCPVFRPFL